jgi:hypothetical protein
MNKEQEQANENISNLLIYKPRIEKARREIEKEVFGE